MTQFNCELNCPMRTRTLYFTSVSWSHCQKLVCVNMNSLICMHMALMPMEDASLYAVTLQIKLLVYAKPCILQFFALPSHFLSQWIGCTFTLLVWRTAIKSKSPESSHTQVNPWEGWPDFFNARESESASPLDTEAARVKRSVSTWAPARG